MSNTKCRPMAKRLLSVLFAITLVTGLVPISAYAAIGDSKSTTPAETTQSQEQEAQGTDSKDASKDNKDEGADSDSSASDKGASVEEPATEEETTDNAAASSSNDNGVSSGENAISLADNGISLTASNGNEWKYNGDTGLSGNDVYKKLAQTFTYEVKTPWSKYQLAYTAYKIDGKTFSALSGSDKWYPNSGTYEVQGSKTGYGSWTKVGTFTFQKQWDTIFGSNLTEGGATSLEGATLSKLTSNDGDTVSFKVKKVQVPGSSAENPVYYDATVKCGDREIAPTGDVYSLKVEANATVSVEYNVPKADLDVEFNNSTVKVGSSEPLDKSGKVEANAGFTTPATITPASGYAVTSVKLSGGDLAEAEELLTDSSFSSVETRAAEVTIPALTKDKSYTLTVETKQCELKLQESPSAAVKGLTDKDKIKQRVIEGVLDLENSVPSNISADDLEIKYSANKNWTDWKNLDFDPNWVEELAGYHKFGSQDNETIQITYNGNTQYCSLSKEASIQITDGRIATHIEANESVSVKYAPEDDLKKAIEAAIAPKVYDEDGDQIIDPQVEFDYSNFNRTVGTQYVTVKYPGNEEYKNSELTVEVQIAKGDAKVTVNSQSITYGEQFTTPLVSADPSEAWPIYAIVGIDGSGSSYVSIDFSSVVISEKTPWGSTVNVKLQDIITRILGNEFSASAVLDNLGYIEDALRALGITDASEICSNIRKVLEAIEKVAPGVMDSKIVLGGTPDQAGVYAVTAVSVNPNYTNDVAVGYLTIAPATQNVKLGFKNELPSYSMTIDEAKSFDFSAGLYQGGLDITSKGNVASKFIGTDYDGNVYSSTSAPTDPGVYSQVVTNIGGNYYASPISRAFVIKRVATNLTIFFDGATGDEQSVVYTGSQVTPTFKVTSGDTVLDSSSVEAYYVDSSQGYWKLDAPTNAGTYTVYALYPGTGYYDSATASCKLTIKQQSIDPASDDYRGVEVQGIDDVVYDGNEHVWNPVVKDAAGNELVRKTDYLVSYEPYDFTNAGEIKVTITGIGNYTGQVVKTYKIDQQSINPEDEDTYLGVQIDSPENVVYNGKDQKWVPAVTDKAGNPLTEGTDYTVSYSTDDFANAGEVTVTITGKGNYAGEVERTYTIEKAAIEVADSATKVYNGAEQMFYVQATNATGLAEGEVLTLSDAQVKGTEPGVYTEVSPYKWEVVKADGKTDSTVNYTINVSGTLTITAADSAATDSNDGNSTKADKGNAPQTGDITAPLAAGAAIAAAAALVALFLSRKLRRNGTR